MQSTIPPDPDVMRGALKVLSAVEALGEADVGALDFGPLGKVLVESRKICWAAAAGMTQRLSDLLRQQRNPPLERDFLESVLRECQRTGTPLGEALLASGEITEAGLRTAVFRQTVEAIAHLGRAVTTRPKFVSREGIRYDARFLFAPPEVFAAIGAAQDPALATAGRRHLERMLGPKAPALAFSHVDHLHHLMVAIHVSELRVAVLDDMCAWSADLFQMAALLDSSAFVASAVWACARYEQTASLVVWRAIGLTFVALCEQRAEAAVLIGRVIDARAREAKRCPES